MQKYVNEIKKIENHTFSRSKIFYLPGSSVISGYPIGMTELSSVVELVYC